MITEKRHLTVSTPMERDDFTTIIPAAGRGSRLQCLAGKLFLEVLGKPLLQWVLSLVADISKQIIIVHAKTTAIPPQLMQPYCDRIILIEQSNPYGTAHAVKAACNAINTKFTNVIWVDQITMLYANILRCLEYAQHNDNYSLVFPVINIKNPYVHFQVNGKNKITKVLYKREQDNMPRFGVKDAGFFIFKTEALKAVLSNQEYYERTLGRYTKEYNLLSLFPILENYGKGVKQLKVISPQESHDINTPEDAIKVANIIKGRDLCQQSISYYFPGVQAHPS